MLNDKRLVVVLPALNADKTLRAIAQEISDIVDGKTCYASAPECGADVVGMLRLRYPSQPIRPNNVI